jgi:uncharacterized protein (TIRG00374 family)
MALHGPRLLRRGLEVFAAISLLGFAGLLLYGNNLDRFLTAMVSLDFRWVLVGIALASLDWFGGGLRLYVLARHVFHGQSLKGAILAGGLNTWASYLTPSQTGGGPMMIYALKRYGTPLPEGTVASLMSFVATIIFFAIAGPLAVFFGAGRSLARHGVIGRAVNLYDLFRLSLGGFVGIGVLLLILIVFPSVARALVRRLVRWAEQRQKLVWAARFTELAAGVERGNAAVRRFASPRGWLAMLAAVVLSAAAHANKLLAGFVVLKMLGIPAPFLDVLLLQTLITFLLYFAPTPGGSGLAELLSAAVMSIYVPRELTPSYILLWRLTVSYLTVGFGSIIFWHWLKGAELREDFLTAP